MKILINNENAVVAWQTVGGGWSDTEYTTVEVAEIPEEVKANPSQYYYIDNQYILNDIVAFSSVKETKITELSLNCSATIFNGMDITLSDGSVQHFTLTERDQLNLSGIGLKLAMGATQISWHRDDETLPCQYYSAADAQTIIGTLTIFKEYNITYFRDLRIYVNNLTSVEDVLAINYGYALPENAKSQVLKDYEAILFPAAE